MECTLAFELLGGKHLLRLCGHDLRLRALNLLNRCARIEFDQHGSGLHPVPSLDPNAQHRPGNLAGERGFSNGFDGGFDRQERLELIATANLEPVGRALCLRAGCGFGGGRLRANIAHVDLKAHGQCQCGESNGCLHVITHLIICMIVQLYIKMISCQMATLPPKARRT
jgi:hypothetical protein